MSSCLATLVSEIDLPLDLECFFEVGFWGGVTDLEYFGLVVGVGSPSLDNNSISSGVDFDAGGLVCSSMRCRAITAAPLTGVGRVRGVCTAGVTVGGAQVACTTDVTAGGAAVACTGGGAVDSGALGAVD